MAHVAVVGAGHVGLVYAAGLAALDHTVRVVDIDRRKVERLRAGDVWFYEPGLPELLRDAARAERITFTTDFREAVVGSDFVFVCVPTPTRPDGALDDRMLRSVFASLREVASHPPPIIVNKSTVPVGASDVADRIFGGDGLKVVSSPEFLAEGRAVADFFRPSRIVLGSRERATAEAVRQLFAAIEAPTVYTDNATAEFSKLAANAFLAMKVSFANALATLSQAVGAEVGALTEILSLDARIGAGHLTAGLGFGGSCLPKDLAAIEHLARRHAAHPALFAEVARVNAAQITIVAGHLARELGPLTGRRIAVLGLSFKPGTDDVRESPALALAAELRSQGAVVVLYDPVARPDLSEHGLADAMATDPLAAARGADAVVLATEWPEISGLDLGELREVVKGDVLVDGRGIVPPESARAAGFRYFGFGRG